MLYNTLFKVQEKLLHLSSIPSANVETWIKPNSESLIDALFFTKTLSSTGIIPVVDVLTNSNILFSFYGSNATLSIEFMTRERGRYKLRLGEWTKERIFDLFNGEVEELLDVVNTKTYTR